MIVDQLRSAKLYAGMGERFAAAFEYLRTHNFNDIKDGTYPIRGQEVYAVVARYTPKPMSPDRELETHRKYFDVQYMAAGREQMGYAPLDTLTVTETYNEEGDYIALKGPMSTVDAPAGMFFIFGPEDAHMPGVAAPQGNGPVIKVVVKVAV